MSTISPTDPYEYDETWTGYPENEAAAILRDLPLGKADNTRNYIIRQLATRSPLEKGTTLRNIVRLIRPEEMDSLAGFTMINSAVGCFTHGGTAKDVYDSANRAFDIITDGMDNYKRSEIFDAILHLKRDDAADVIWRVCSIFPPEIRAKHSIAHEIQLLAPIPEDQRPAYVERRRQELNIPEEDTSYVLK